MIECSSEKDIVSSFKCNNKMYFLKKNNNATINIKIEYEVKYFLNSDITLFTDQLMYFAIVVFLSSTFIFRSYSFLYVFDY